MANEQNQDPRRDQQQGGNPNQRPGQQNQQGGRPGQQGGGQQGEHRREDEKTTEADRHIGMDKR